MLLQFWNPATTCTASRAPQQHTPCVLTVLYLVATSTRPVCVDGELPRRQTCSAITLPA
ncbi:hypothetical protein HN51_023804, partial [Arachis hypogaea]